HLHRVRGVRRHQREHAHRRGPAGRGGRHRRAALAGPRRRHRHPRDRRVRPRQRLVAPGALRHRLVPAAGLQQGPARPPLPPLRRDDRTLDRVGAPGAARPRRADRARRQGPGVEARCGHRPHGEVRRGLRRRRAAGLGVPRGLGRPPRLHRADALGRGRGRRRGRRDAPGDRGPGLGRALRAVVGVHRRAPAGRRGRLMVPRARCEQHAAGRDLAGQAGHLPRLPGHTHPPPAGDAHARRRDARGAAGPRPARLSDRRAAPAHRVPVPPSPRRAAGALPIGAQAPAGPVSGTLRVAAYAPAVPPTSGSALLDLRPFRASSAFAKLWIGSTLAGLGGQLTVVTVMLHVFELTGSTFAVSMVAVAGLVPMIIAGLYGGMLADAFDRRRVALLAAVVTFASTALLAALTWADLENIGWLYLLSVINSAANSVGMATRTAIVPRLIPAELLAAASALNGITQGVMVMVGPALAGVLVALTGYGLTYSIDVMLMLAMFMGLWSLPALRPEGEIVRPGIASLVDGWRYLRRSANIRTQYLMDITA